VYNCIIFIKINILVQTLKKKKAKILNTKSTGNANRSNVPDFIQWNKLAKTIKMTNICNTFI